MKEWLMRWWQNKGFGIESKTDYAFLTDVIKEDCPYYAYEDIRCQHPDYSEYAIVEGKLEDSDEWQTYLNGRYITYDMVDMGIAIRALNREPEHYRILRV